MNLVYDLRFRPNALESSLAGLDVDLKAAALRRAAIAVAFAVTIVGGIVLLGFKADPNAVLCFGGMGTIIFIIIAVRQWDRYQRKRDKVDFVRDLTRALQVDLHPRSKARLALDLRPYNHSRKLVASAWSTSGRKAKNKYRDKWLALDLRLAEGTRVVIRREVGIKTKAGTVQREKRRLFLAVKPNPSRYDLYAILGDAQQLRKRLKDAVHTMFANHPDDFHVHVDPDDGGLRIKVSQTDAQFEVDEVLRLLHALIAFLAAREKRARV